MCVGVHYTLGSRETRVLFTDKAAQLPVWIRGRVELVPWGRKTRQAGVLPLGGNVHRDAVLAGNWDRFKPKAVRILVQGFAEQDVEGRVRWHPVTRGKWIKGLLAKAGAEQRVYVVSITPDLDGTPYARWPDIRNG